MRNLPSPPDRTRALGLALVLPWLLAGCTAPASTRVKASFGDRDAQVALAQGYDAGTWTSPDPARAHWWYGKAARAGDVRAQLALGRSYAHGVGVLEDQAEALRWYERAAASGSSEAQLELAESYDSGYGVLQDQERATYWYAEAARRGHVEACYQLALRLEGHESLDGEESAESSAQAAAWYRCAAERGHPRAQLALGVMFATGSGVEEDLGTAWYWLRSSAEAGVDDARLALRILEPRMLPPERAEGEQRFHQALAAETGALSNLAEVQYAMGVRYALGEGVERDPTEAVGWWRRAAQRGHRTARLELGMAYARGVGVSRDPARAWAWLRLAQGAPQEGLRAAWMDRVEAELDDAGRARAGELALQGSGLDAAPKPSLRSNP